LWARKTKSHNILLGHVQSHFHHTEETCTTHHSGWVSEVVKKSWFNQNLQPYFTILFPKSKVEIEGK
jgi:hypothetical protein